MYIRDVSREKPLYQYMCMYMKFRIFLQLCHQNLIKSLKNPANQTIIWHYMNEKSTIASVNKTDQRSNNKKESIHQ